MEETREELNADAELEYQSEFGATTIVMESDLLDYAQLKRQRALTWACIFENQPPHTVVPGANSAIRSTVDELCEIIRLLVAKIKYDELR